MAPYREVLWQGAATMPSAAQAATARKRLVSLRTTGNSNVQALVNDMMLLIDACDRFAFVAQGASGLNKNATKDLDVAREGLQQKRKAVYDRLAALEADQKLMEKLVREGF